MTIKDLITELSYFDPSKDVFTAIFKTDNTAETFDINDVVDNNGQAQLNIGKVITKAFARKP